MCVCGHRPVMVPEIWQDPSASLDLENGQRTFCCPMWPCYLYIVFFCVLVACYYFVIMLKLRIVNLFSLLLLANKPCCMILLHRRILANLYFWWFSLYTYTNREKREQRN